MESNKYFNFLEGGVQWVIFPHYPENRVPTPLPPLWQFRLNLDTTHESGELCARLFLPRGRKNEELNLKSGKIQGRGETSNRPAGWSVEGDERQIYIRKYMVNHDGEVGQ